MKLTRQHAWGLELSEKELQILRKVLKDEELSPEEEALSFALSGKVEHAYAKASEWGRVGKHAR
jgi:hypothetical protein